MSDPTEQTAPGAPDPMSAPIALGYTFCRDNHVLLDGTTLFVGQAARVDTLLEVRRAFGSRLADIIRLDQSEFDLRLSARFQDADARQTVEEDDVVHFDLDDSTISDTPNDLLEGGDTAPVIRLVNAILRQAVARGASDVHVEPKERGLLVRMRVDGILSPAIRREDVPVRQIVARFKVMAHLDTSENRLPQDGRIALRYGDRSIDVRFSSLPGINGERLVMRLLDRKTGLRALEELGLDPAQEAALRRIAGMSDGMVLTTGPTGSGKTTTLYSLLNTIDTVRRNVVTVEDPVEYKPEGVSQIQISADIGMTFAVGLRAALRQDPDVIMVGEIRDAETARIASQASLTGHLVLSSLHANTCVGAITRLRDLGLEDFLISSTLRAALAQRTLRRICRACDGAGCEACGQTGYAGRIGVFEVAEVTEDAARAIAAGRSEQDLGPLLARHGLEIAGQARALVQAGITDAAEVQRVFGVF